jgi:hypothetical protein
MLAPVGGQVPIYSPDSSLDLGLDEAGQGDKNRVLCDRMSTIYNYLTYCDQYKQEGKMGKSRALRLSAAVILMNLLSIVPLRSDPVTLHSDPVTLLGRLDCETSGSAGLLFFKTNTTVSCVFNGVSGEKDDHYSGEIEVALEVGAVAGTRQEWSVEGVRQSVPHGALAGTYAGSSADLIVAAGVGGYVLQGRGGKSYWLKSLSLGNRTGLHASIGIATLTLNQVSSQ